MADTDDFSIEITPTSTGYSVRASAPTGRAQADVLFPLSSLELENRLQAVELSLLRGRGGLRRALSESEQQSRELGQILFDFLFSDDVRALFDLSRLEAERAEQRLRLLLTLDAPELAALPWELLYHSREGEFLALSHATPLVRYSTAPYAQNALAVTPPLRVLGVVAGPTDWEALDVAQEKQRLEDALASLQQADRAELVWIDGQTRRDLQSAMRAGPWHIIHFIGHGGYDEAQDEGFIVLCDEDGRAARLYATELARLIADHFSLRLVFLNACEGATSADDDDLASSAAALVRRSVPAVVAMQYPISDNGAIEFARTFYESLADNLPIDAAVTDARKSVSLAAPHSPEWATPVLFLAAQDGRLFSLEKAADALPPPPPPLPQDETPAAEKRGAGFPRLLWLLALLTILAVVVWQSWPGRGEETAAIPAAAPAAVNAPTTTPTTTPTPFPTIDEAEYQSGMATAMAEETATSAALTPTPQPTPTPVSGWARLGEGGPEIDGWVNALAVTDETVYIGGSFKNPSPGLLAWDRHTGEWGTLGEGLTGTVQTLLVDGSDVYVGGDFSVIGTDGETIRGLARWDGEAWRGFGSGLSGLNRGPVAGVAALALDGEKNLYVGGIFTGAGNGNANGASTGGVTARGILRWNRALSRWQLLGGDEDASGLVRFSGDTQPVFVAALEVVGEYLYAGGHFAAIADRNGGSFPNSRNFARWHIPTESWEGVGRVGSNSEPAVYAIAADGDDIYVGGDFDTVYDEAGTPINAVLLARWNGASREWGGICCINDKDYGRTLANGLVSYGTIGVVRALVNTEKGLYVAGRFNEAGDQTVNNVARYRNGVWARLAMRTGAGATVAGVDDTIFALAPANDEWIVGGKFTEFGETKNGSGLARWGE